MNILLIKHFFVGFMVSEIPRVYVFGYCPYSVTFPYSVFSEFICKPISSAVSSILCSSVFSYIRLLVITAISLTYMPIGNIHNMYCISCFLF